MTSAALFVLPSERMGGAERITINLAEAAAKGGIFSTVYLFVLASRSGDLPKLSPDSKVIIIVGGRGRERRGLLNFLNFIRKNDFSFSFSSHTHINVLLSSLRRINFLRSGFLVTRESTVIFERKFSHSKRFALRMMYYLYGSQDLIICQTPHMRNSLLANIGNKLSSKTVVIPNPIIADCDLEVADFNITQRTDCTNIIWCGRLESVKSPERGIYLLRDVVKSGEFAHLYIVGDGRLLDSLKELVRKFELGSFVTFTGYLDNPRKVMKHCSVGIITSDLEGFPNVALEMLSSGIGKIISTNCCDGLNGIPGVNVSTIDRYDEEDFFHLYKRSVDGDRVSIDNMLLKRSVESYMTAITSIHKNA